jgi:hypothetical protein
MPSDNLPVKRSSHAAVPAMFEQLGIRHVRTSDRFKVEYRNGVMTASVTRESGHAETVVKRVKGGFVGYTSYDPAAMTRSERNELIQQRYKEGLTQTQLAAMFGLSQSMIAKIVSE